MTNKVSKPRASKHKKHSWKHIDLTEVNQYLEDKELDERTGQTGKEVFFIEKKGDKSNFENNVETTKKESNLSKTKQIIESLKAYKHLKSTSAIPAFKVNQAKKTKKPVINHIRLTKKFENLVESVKNKKSRKNKNEKNKNKITDLWQEKPKKPIGDTYIDYAEDFEKVRLARIFKCPSKPTIQSLKKPSLLPAVEEPHPGLSYNPKSDDHANLLIAIGDRKKKEIKAKKKLNKLVAPIVDTSVDLHEEYENEMLQGIISDDNQDEEIDNDEKINMDKSANIITDLKRRKSKKQLRHETKVLKEKIAAKKKKEKNIFETEFFNIKNYVKDHQKQEELIKERQKLKEAKAIEKLYKPANLGKQQYIEPEPEFCLESELNGSLRKINTDGNLIMDRFKSLQKRNIIEHRHVLLQKRAKAKRKRVIRASIYNKDLFSIDNAEDEKS